MNSAPPPSRFTSEPIGIAGVLSITLKPLADQRGSFTRLFCADELFNLGWSTSVAQVNYSYTAKKGSIRGMHFQQPPFSEAKLVTCLRQSVWDVVVDLRTDSETFLKWYALELSADNHKAILIPPGCAHGFQTLSDDVELLYFHSRSHVSEADDGVNPLDPVLNIEWPLNVSVISEKDANQRLLGSNFLGLKV
jgi:dTDP-4-dehydrorhamnose 3,5-epimerase